MRIRQALLLLASVLMISGCSAGVSVENLLTPPKLEAEQNEIYQALINSVGTGIKLKYPKGGDYRSAFVLQNIDDEPGNEALVFYESASVQAGENALRLKLLDKNDGKWNAVYDIACVGSEVDSISFAELGAGGINIIVRYSMLGKTEKSFSVINYRDGVPVELLASSYSCLEVIDLNADGEDELFCVVPDKVNETSSAVLYASTENGFERLSETALGGGISDYISVTKGMLNERTNALFLDYSRGSGLYGTDVVYCIGNRLINPDTAGVDIQENNISRFTNDYMAEIFCSDIDNDGFVEIPATIPLPGYETLSRSEQLCAVRWYTVEYKKPVAKHYSYYSSKFRFVLLFPNRWQGVVTAAVNYADNEIIFYSYDSSKSIAEYDEGNELMRIRAVSRTDESLTEQEAQYKVLGENEETVYLCYETKGYKTGRLALTDAELKNCFIIL